MSGRLIALDKMPGIRPIGIGETWRRLFAKSVIEDSGAEVVEACGCKQLCAGLKAGIEGAVHTASSFWEEHCGDDQTGFLLIDASNAFNEMNRIRMLYEIRYRWPSGAQFVFNCYRHWSKLLLRSPSGCLHLYSMEGVTQGDPTAMLMYGIGTLPIIHQLNSLRTEAMQLWYADDASIGGKFANICKMFDKLTEIGPRFGYFPNPKKCILLVHKQCLSAALAYFKQYGFQIKDGARFLGGYIGTTSGKNSFIQDKVLNWTTAINDLSQVATVYPQTAYTGLSKSLQHEWAYIQRVIPNIANELLPIQASITNTFLPSLFGHALQDDYVSAMTSFPVQLGGLSLPNPRTDSPYNYQSSLLLASHLIRSLRGQEDFSVMTHLAMRKSISIRRTADLAQRHLALICEITKDLPPLTKRILDRGQSTGHWLSVFPSTFTDTQPVTCALPSV